MWTQQHELPASQVYTDLYTEACRCLSRRVGPWNPGYEDLIVGILLDLPKLELPWIVFDGFQDVCDVCVCVGSFIVGEPSHVSYQACVCAISTY